MPNEPLGRLDKVNLHDIWAGEASDFTPWLASEENISLLGDTLGLELEVEGTEESVGPFRADILCMDTASDRYVLIENQLERTDHTHLGQIITYAAGLDAVVIVWIASKFTDEHRAAIDWLNRVTGEEANFFAFEIEAWQIGNSPIAPRFNVVCRPNEWSKSVKQTTGLSDTQELQLEYWTTFRALLENYDTKVKPTKPQAAHWMTFAIGKAYFHLVVIATTKHKRISVYLNIFGPNRLSLFHLLHQDKEAIEHELDLNLEWLEMSDKKESHIQWSRGNTDPANRNNWQEHHKTLCNVLDKFHRVFGPRVKMLNTNESEAENKDI